MPPFLENPTPPSVEPAPATLQPEFPPPPSAPQPRQLDAGMPPPPPEAAVLPPGAIPAPVPQQGEMPVPALPDATAANDATTQAVQEIKKDLGKKGPIELDDHVRQEIFQTLDELRSNSKNFEQDLMLVNAKLQQEGYLPNLFISEIEPGEQVAADKLIGPNSKEGFHIDSTMTPPAPTGGEIDFSPPQHDAPAPDQNQSAWHEANPGNPVGSTGAEPNIGGSTPIGDGAVESNPVNMPAMGTPELMSQIEQALELLNAQRAAQGLPPIEATPENMQAILKIIEKESGGNPNAQNNTDSNAAKGDPSRGLMQTIGSTFSSYHVQGTSNNIFDPVANIAAGVNYAVSRYGSLQEVPGIKATAAGGAYVGY